MFVHSVYTRWVSDNAPSEPRLRIGELSQRVGESPTLLRAWERRYHLLEPVRTSGGYRLYGAEDERRVRAMQALLATGVSARQAAEAVLAAPRVTEAAADLELAAQGASLAASRAQLGDALGSYEESAAHAVLDRLFAGFTIETAISKVIVPYLADLGERWAAGTATIAQEHFATSLIRGRLLGLARGWDSGTGRRALLACPSGELHDLGLLCFGIALRVADHLPRRGHPDADASRHSRPAPSPPDRPRRNSAFTSPSGRSRHQRRRALHHDRRGGPRSKPADSRTTPRRTAPQRPRHRRRQRGSGRRMAPVRLTWRL